MLRPCACPRLATRRRDPLVGAVVWAHDAQVHMLVLPAQTADSERRVLTNCGTRAYRHRTIPNGSAEFVCTVGSIPKLFGPQTRPTEELLSPGPMAVGVRFRPGAAPPLLAAPASELLDGKFRT